MKHGNRSRFAIEIELNDSYGGAWLFGKFCYWILGKMIGDFSSGTSLRDVLFQMRYVVGDAGHRHCPALLELDDEEAFSLIESALDEDSKELSAYLSQNLVPAAFDVTIPVDIFDGWRIFLVQGNEETRILYRTLGSREIHSANLEIGEFEAVARAAYNEIDQMYEANR